MSQALPVPQRSHDTMGERQLQANRMVCLQIVDTITVAGPREAGSYTDNSPESKLVQWRLPKCGAGTIKYRTELTLKATKAGAEGSVNSEKTQWEGKTGFYGVQQGVSYDWEKCVA